MRVDYNSYQTFEVCGLKDTYNETEITIGLTCTHPSRPGSFNPYDGGYPPEGPEFELASISLDVPKVKSKSTPKELDKPLELTWNQFCALVGEEMAEAMYDRAVDDACESGGF